MKQSKNGNKFILFAIIGIVMVAFLLSGCPTPFDNLQSQIDENDDDITRIDGELDSIRVELDSIQAWMITTDAQLANAFQLIGENASDIDELRQDMEDGDEDLQNQLDDLLDLFWEKYTEVSDRISDVEIQLDEDVTNLYIAIADAIAVAEQANDELRDELIDAGLNAYNELTNRINDVILQANQDRQEYRRGLMIAFKGIAITNWRITQLENVFQNAAANFQAQLDDLKDDLVALETALRAEIQDLATDIAANASQITNLWAEIAYIFANYYTAAQVDAMFDLIDADIVAIRNRLDGIDIELATKITVLEAEQETYRILFGDNAINPDGSLKAYYRDKMYWSGNFQGFSHVVNSTLYQIAQGIKNDSYTPPSHVANSVVSALRDFYTSAEELGLAVDNLQMQIDTLNSLHSALRTEFDAVAGDYLSQADYLILMDAINTLRSDMDAELATKLSVYTFRYNRDMIYESLADLASIRNGWVPFEFKLHSSISSVSNISVVASPGEIVPVNSAGDSDPLTFQIYHRDGYYYYDNLGSTVDITVSVPGVGTTMIRDVPVYKLLLDGTGVYPQLRIYDGGSYQSLVLDSQFGSQAERF